MQQLRLFAVFLLVGLGLLLNRLIQMDGLSPIELPVVMGIATLVLAIFQRTDTVPERWSIVALWGLSAATLLCGLAAAQPADPVTKWLWLAILALEVAGTARGATRARFRRQSRWDVYYDDTARIQRVRRGKAGESVLPAALHRG